MVIGFEDCFDLFEPKFVFVLPEFVFVLPEFAFDLPELELGLPLECEEDLLSNTISSSSFSNSLEH